jgi:hypothetical protein
LRMKTSFNVQLLLRFLHHCISQLHIHSHLPLFHHLDPLFSFV